jgi:ATP-binding cassette subfamily B protein RaxB
VSFRYAETEPFVLEDINLVIEAGQSVAIMGPSGGGKTTLVKIMLGLLEPTSGEVLIDGVPLLTIGYKAYREQIGAVMQEDQLLSGSIADNNLLFRHLLRFGADDPMRAGGWDPRRDYGDDDDLQLLDW